MVEPTFHWATWLFVWLIALMMVAAGGAALPPARDTRVLVGATTFFGAWLGTLFLQRTFQDWNITSAFFVLDFLYATIFYLLSRPSRGATSGSVYERNWAGDVFFVFAAIIILELAHFAEFYLPPPAGTIVLLLIVVAGLLLAFGFWRGYGALRALQFTLFAVALASAAHFSYGAGLNFLSALAVLIITLRGIRVLYRNVRQWTAALRGGGRETHDHRESVSAPPP